MTRETAPIALERALSAAGLDWIVPDWPAPTHVGALATTISGGVSAGPYATMNLGRNGRDDASALAENQRRLKAFLPEDYVPSEKDRIEVYRRIDRARVSAEDSPRSSLGDSIRRRRSKRSSRGAESRRA